MSPVMDLKPCTGIIKGNGKRGENHCQYLRRYIWFVCSANKVRRV